MSEDAVPSRLCPSCGSAVPGELKAPTELRAPGESKATPESDQCAACGYPLLPPPASDTAVLRDLLRGIDRPAVSADAVPTEPISAAPPTSWAGLRARMPARILPAQFRRPGIGLVAAVVLLIALGAAVGAAGLVAHIGSRPARSTALAPAPILATHEIDPGTIHASASSTLDPDKRGYRAANTLDKRDDTAWNSDGKRVGPGVGVRLQWRFDSPQHVVRITVLNGYLHSRRDPTVFADNGRIKRVRVTTDRGSTDWSLADSPRPQSLQVDLGTTGSVRFEVLEVYPGDRYPDLALTGISFDAAG